MAKESELMCGIWAHPEITILWYQNSHENYAQNGVFREYMCTSVHIHCCDHACFPSLSCSNEREGIPVEVIHLLDDCVEIPQFGVIRSLNVHVSGALMIWEYTKQHTMTNTSTLS